MNNPKKPSLKSNKVDVFDYYLSSIDNSSDFPIHNSPRKRTIVLDFITKYGRKLPDVDSFENIEKLLKPLVIKHAPKTKREFVAEFLQGDGTNLAFELTRRNESDEFIKDLDLLGIGVFIISDCTKFDKLIDYLGLEIISDLWVEITLSQICNNEPFDLKELITFAMYGADTGRLDDYETRFTIQKEAYFEEIRSVKLENMELKKGRNRAIILASLSLGLFIFYGILLYIYTGFTESEQAESTIKLLLCLAPMVIIPLVISGLLGIFKTQDKMDDDL